MENRVSCFGVGCLHFGTSIDVPCQFKLTEYASDLQSLLESIETVEEVNVSCDEDEYELVTQPESMRDGGLFPRHGIYSVQFSLRIPRRIQSELLRNIWPSWYPFTDAGTEQFRMYTNYYYDGPVTIVECLNVVGWDEHDPSDAVAIVRDYLERKAEEHGSKLRLETIGPSPFHADFLVVEDKTIQTPYKVDHDDSRPYDRITLRVSPAIFEERATWLFELMGTHLSFFYSLRRKRSRRMRDWDRIEEKWIDIRGTPGSMSPLRKVQGWLGRRARIAALVRDTTLFRANTVFQEQDANSRQSVNTKKNAPSFLDHKIQEAMAEIGSEYPTSEILELAKFHEERSAKLLDRASVFIAATIGAL